MVKPNASSARYDQFLTSLLVGFRNEQESYGHLAVPTILHNDESGLYPIISDADWMRLAAKVRARSTPAHMSGFKMETGSFKCVPWSLAQPIDIDDAAKAADPVDLDMAAAMYVADQMLLANESAFATAAFTASVWGTTDQTGVTGTPSTNEFKWWSDSAATPAKNIAALNSAMKKNTGRKGNTLFVTDDVDAAVRFCPDVIDRVKYTNPNAIDNNAGGPGVAGVTNPVEMAKYFGVRNYVVCGAAYNRAVEEATKVGAFFASNKALLCYLDDPGVAGGQGLSLTNARFRPTALAAIRYELPGSQNGKRVRSYYREDIKSNVVEGDESFVYHRPLRESATNSGKNPLGQLLTSVLS